MTLMTHLEELCSTDSQAEKRAEIRGFVKKWRGANYPLYIAMYLDVLSPIHRLSLSEQKNEHDPVKAVKRIKDFSSTMSKMQAFIDSALDDEGIENDQTNLTHFNKVISQITLNENDYYSHQGTRSSRFEEIKAVVPQAYKDAITGISKSVAERFSDLEIHPVFRHLIPILDCRKLPSNDEAILRWGDDAICELYHYFKGLLNDSCVPEDTMIEWNALKTI